MIVYISVDELYPDVRVYSTPIHYADSCDVPDELVREYVSTRSAYLKLRDKLLELPSEPLGIVEGLTGNSPAGSVVELTKDR